MKSLLIRLYPARWRARYGEEFEAILDERPLGPFDVADVILGALDAQLRLRRMGSDMQHGKGFSMSLRIGGFAAILGGSLLATGIVIGTGFPRVDPAVPGALGLTGSGALLVAMAGLTAFQARVHPVLTWAAFAVTAVGMIVSVVGIVGMELVGEGYWNAFTFGIIGAFVGSALFSIATFRTAALSRTAALLLGIVSILTILAGLGGNIIGPNSLIVTSIAFAVCWFALGVHAVRLDRPATASQPV